MNFAADRRAIRSLRVGVVPSSHVLDLTVGMPALRATLERESEAFRAGQQQPCVVSGEWGSGKSNLLSYLREYALRRNIAVAYINLNGRSAAISHPQRFYHHIISDLRLPRLEGKGITTLLTALKRPDVESAASKWATANAKSSELAQAFVAFLSGQEMGALPVILGTDLAWADYSYKKYKAVKRIADLGSCLKSLGYVGLLVQYDELETVVHLWSAVSRQNAYRVLQSLSDLTDVWSVFAATEKLNQQLRSDLDRLKNSTARTFVDGYFNLPVLNPPPIDERLGGELLQSIESLYRRVYPVPLDARLQPIMEKWLRMPFRNPRRLIRLAIDYLDRQREVPWV
jgi:hypothetical protein